MSELILDTATKQRVIDELNADLQAFHMARNKNVGGFESVSWRGRLAGLRGALNIIVGSRATAEILNTVRQQTGLGFPHVGPVMDDGSIYDMDSEAQPGL